VRAEQVSALRWSALSWYARSWAEFEFMHQAGLLLLAGLGALVSLARFRVAAALLLCWAIGGYAALWLIGALETRYDLPLLPAFALLSGGLVAALLRVGLPRVARAGLATLIVAAVTAYGVVSLAWNTLGVDDLAEVARLSGSPETAPRPPPRPEPAMRVARDYFAVAYVPGWWWPSAEDWRQHEIFLQIRAARQSLRLPRARVAFVPFLVFFQADTFRYAALTSGEPVTIVTDNWSLSNPGSRSQVATADLAVLKTGAQTTPRLRFSEAVSAEREAFAAALLDPTSEVGRPFAQRFALARRFPLPDGSDALLYVRR
jgi:hypothetical protein